MKYRGMKKRERKRERERGGERVNMSETRQRQ